MDVDSFGKGGKKDKKEKSDGNTISVKMTTDTDFFFVQVINFCNFFFNTDIVCSAITDVFFPWTIFFEKYTLSCVYTLWGSF